MFSYLFGIEFGCKCMIVSAMCFEVIMEEVFELMI